MGLLVQADRGQAYQRNYSGRPTTTWGTTLTGSATPHALPASPTQVISSTTYETEWIRLAFHGMHNSNTITDALCNIYIGGAGSETLFIDSLQCGWCATAPATGVAAKWYWFPVRIPKGTRISASLRNLVGSSTVYLMVDLGVSNGRHWVGSGVETLGEVTASSRGTSVTPGSTSEGTATSIGTTGRQWHFCRLDAMGNNDSSLVSDVISWDVTDSGGNVLQGMENWTKFDHTDEYQAPWSQWPGWWCDIDSGNALYARGQCDTTASGLQYVCLYGVY